MNDMLRSAKLAPTFDYAILERFWKDADDLGFYGVWNYDHFYGLAENPEAPTLEGWTTLAAMAALTSQARLGCMVTGVTYRHPAVLAKMAVAVDHISGGRLEFGLGAAWHQAEHEGYGIAFPSAGTRIAMLDEAVEIIRRLWTEDKVDHEGQFWSLTGALCNPKPVQAHVPIVIGGSGERKTLRVVAKHADEWNFPATHGVDEFRRLSEVLDQHCADVGRDPKEIARSIQLFIRTADTTPGELLAEADAYAAAGAHHMVFSFYVPPPPGLLAGIAPR